MDHLQQFIHIILHLNLYVGLLVEQYHLYTLAILMLIIFCETGLVVTPFLPGDSLLFASGLVFSTTEYHIFLIVLMFILAAFCGDNSNYWIGRLIGRHICGRYPRVFKPQYLVAAETFYAKYGVMAIIFARFLPLLRTFIPFCAGLSHMCYQRYLFASLISASLWVCLFTLTGYYFGSLPWVQKNFTLVISLIIVVSMLPGIYEFVMYHLYKKNKATAERI